MQICAGTQSQIVGNHYDLLAMKVLLQLTLLSYLLGCSERPNDKTTTTTPTNQGYMLKKDQGIIFPRV